MSAADPGAEESIRIDLEAGSAVAGLWRRCDAPRWTLVLAHGAGAGMRHAFMEEVCAALAAVGIETLRYQFPYMEAGRRRPDPPAVVVPCVRAAAAVAAAGSASGRLLAGGKSFGGRMTTTAAAEAPLDGVEGIVLLGFPLHPPKRSGTTRAEHLARVTVPMLFHQGTRDDLADLELMRDVVDGLGPRATMKVSEGADHGFKVLKRSGRTAREVLDGIAAATAEWADRLGT